jgi:hypothetical protein
MKRFFVCFASALTLLALAGAPANAEPTPAPNAQWTYNFTPQVPNNQVLADPTGGQPGGVTLSNEPTKNATGSSVVVMTNLHVFSAAPPTAPDVFSSQTGFWKTQLILTDSASGASATANFSGKFTGNFSGGTVVGGTLQGGSANIGNIFDPQTVSFKLGNFNYTVSLLIPDPITGNLVPGYTPPGPPGASNGGAISAYVTVTTGDSTGGGPGISSVPEPSTMLLAGLGLSFGGFAAWRTRRRRGALALA